MSQPPEMPGVRGLFATIGVLVGAFVGASMGGSDAYTRIIFMAIGGLMVGLFIAAAVESAAERRRR